MLRYAGYLTKALFLFLLYVVTAKFSLTFDAVGGFATLVWLPTGIVLAALYILGYQFWPAIMAGAFVSNLTQGASVPVSVGIAIGNTAEAVVGTYLLRRNGFRPSFKRLQDVLALLIAVAVAAVVSASIGIASLSLGGVVDDTMGQFAWLAWWTGDFISGLIIAPLLLVWSVPRRFQTYAETVSLVIVVMCIGLVIFGRVFGIVITSSPLTYLVFPPLIWAALRFGPREVITAVFAFSILAVLGTAQGFGPFVRAAGVSQSLMFLQSFIGVIAVTALTLAAAVAERKEAEKRKDEFISMASHELKTPLTTIKAFSQLLVRVLSHTKSMHAKVYAKKLEIQIDKLTRLVNDLLDLSRLQRNQFSLHKTFFSPEGLVREVAQNMQATTKKHTILLIVKKIPRLVYADRERIAQVLTNLISNAIKYSKSSQKIVITVASRHGQLIVSVKDKGIGIDREGQVKLFKRFSRVDDAQSKAIPGLGVGLYIANEIILAHEGRMWLESQLGKGSTFYFSLPTT